MRCLRRQIDTNQPRAPGSWGTWHNAKMLRKNAFEGKTQRFSAVLRFSPQRLSGICLIDSRSRKMMVSGQSLTKESDRVLESLDGKSSSNRAELRRQIGAGWRRHRLHGPPRIFLTGPILIIDDVLDDANLAKRAAMRAFP